MRKCRTVLSGTLRRLTRHQHFALLLALIALSVAAVVIILRKSIWADEALTMIRTQGSLTATVQMSLHVSDKPPLYFLTVWALRLVAPSLEWVRVLSLVSVLGAVVFLDRAAALIGGARGWRSLGVLAAVSGHLVWAATEARQYGMAMFFLAAAIYLFVRGWVRPTPASQWTTVLFVLACYAALLVFHYSGFVLAALFLAGLVFRGRGRLILAGLALTLLMLPWLPTIVGQVEGHSSYLRPVVFRPGAVAWSSDAIQWVAQTVTSTIHRTPPVFNPGLRALAVLGLLVAVIGGRGWQSRGRLDPTEWALLVFTGATLAAFGTLRVLNNTTVDLRHWSVAALPLLLTASYLAGRLRPVPLAVSAQGLLLAASLAGYISTLRNEYGSADWRGAARWIMASERPGEPIMTFNYEPHAFQYHYQGGNVVTQIPEDQATRLDGGRRMALTPYELTRLDAFLRQRYAPEQVFWIVERANVLRGPEVVDAHRPETVEVLVEQSFLGVRAYRLRLRADSPFSGGVP